MDFSLKLTEETPTTYVLQRRPTDGYGWENCGHPVEYVGAIESPEDHLYSQEESPEGTIFRVKEKDGVALTEEGLRFLEYVRNTAGSDRKTAQIKMVWDLTGCGFIAGKNFVELWGKSKHKECPYLIARDRVVAWLRNGGIPTDDIPFKYDYNFPKVEHGRGCAGAAMAWVLGFSSAYGVGAKLYGDGGTFYGFTGKGLDSDNTRQIADWLEKLPIEGF